MTGTAHKRAKVLAVVNRKGGVAKTTTAIALAHGLSRKLMSYVRPEDLDRVPDQSRLFHYQGMHYYIRGHVLLIDMDPQGHCSQGLGVEPDQADLGEVLLGRQSVAQAVISADRTEVGYPRPNLWLIPASDRLETAKIEVTLQALNPTLGRGLNFEGQLRQLLQQRLGVILNRFAFIILDCPPSLDVLARAVYQFADGAIVPVKLDHLGFVGMGQHVMDIRQAQLRGIDIHIHTILPTFYVPRHRLDRQILMQLQTNHPGLLSRPVPRSQLVAEAPAYQRTVFEMDPYAQNAATAAYHELVNRVYHDAT